MKKIILPILLFISSISISLAENSMPEKIIEAQVGQEFTITLDSNATTGFQWQFKEPLDEAMFQLISLDYVVDEKNLVGSGGRQIWVLKALKSGEANISFKYVRSWEKDIPPEKEASFLIISSK
ncbi:MAG: protease inhibitor I42 family protein [Candidatus Omnitrophota bacterium]|jgi:inhibitor of cysteine peptidase